MAKVQTQTVLAFLVVLALAAWGIVVGELVMLGSISALSVAMAAVLTGMLAFWPLLAPSGPRRNLRMPDPCRECGALSLGWPGIQFCLQCGAYPKARALRA